MEKLKQAKQKLISLRDSLKTPDYHVVDANQISEIIESINIQIEYINTQLTDNLRDCYDLNNADSTWDNAPF